MRALWRLNVVCLVALTAVCTMSSSGSAQILFSDDFQRSGPQLVHYQPGGWRPVEGVLRSTLYSFSPIHSHWIALGDPLWTNYQIDFDFRFPTADGVFQFVSHVTDDPNVFFEAADGYRIVLRPSPGNIGVDIQRPSCGGGWREDGVFTPPYLPDWNHLTARVTPGGLELIVNGYFVWRFEIPTCALPPGRFALGSDIGASGFKLVEVDNLVVQGLQPVQSRPETWGRVKAERR